MSKVAKRCRNEVESRIGGIAVISSSLLAGVIALLSGIVILFNFVANPSVEVNLAVLEILLSVWAFVISFFMIFLSIRCSIMENRKYIINSIGFTVCDRNETIYKWNQIYEVAIVAFAASASRQRYQAIICVFLEPPEETFLKKYCRGIFTVL